MSSTTRKPSGSADSSVAPRTRARRIVLPGIAAVGIIGGFLAIAAQVASPPESAERGGAGSGISIVVRTPQNLASASTVQPTVERFASRDVKRAFVQLKQDETD